MNLEEAAAWIQLYRETPELDRSDLLQRALSEHPDFIEAMLAWAENAEGVEPGDYWFFSDAVEFMESMVDRGRLCEAEASLRWMEGDSQQFVLDTAFAALRNHADLQRPYEMIYELLVNSRDLIWEEAFEKWERVKPPADALALARHLIDRVERNRDEAPAFLPLAPRKDSSAADVDALVQSGRFAEAVAARRFVFGEDFATARKNVFASAGNA